MTTCGWCGHEILDKRRRYYCSLDCHQAATDHYYGDGRPASEFRIYPFVCEYCHGEYLTDRPSPEKRGRGRYCSQKCSNLSRQNHQYRICTVCGNRFQPPRIRKHRGVSNRKTCSRECHNVLAKPKSEYVLAWRRNDYDAFIALLRRDSVPQRISPYMDDDCWVWQGSRDRNGYALGPKALGQVLIRSIVELRYGAKLGSQYAHHNCGCGRKGCVRPSHIVPATNAANIAEMRCRTALEARVKELQIALAEYDPSHPLLQQIPVVWS